MKVNQLPQPEATPAFEKKTLAIEIECHTDLYFLYLISNFAPISRMLKGDDAQSIRNELKAMYPNINISSRFDADVKDLGDNMRTRFI
jgi:hypothetical protein